MKASLRQAAHLLRLAAREPSALAALARWKPFSITSFEMLRNLREQGIRPGTVIDGGANVGQFARAALETYPEVRVISFEPLPAAAEKFRKHLGEEVRCLLIEKALGEAEGTIPFHPQEYDLASSVLRPRRGPTTKTIDVPVTDLDAALGDDDLVDPVLLKLDLQGYEVIALHGAARLLERVRWVLVEVAFRSSYEGEATFEQIFELLTARGFRFLRPIDVLAAGNGEIVQMDALFERQQ